MMLPDAKIYVAGHEGLVGSTIYAQLCVQGYKNIIVRRFIDLDLRDQHAVNSFFRKERPEFVFLAAAKVGGIHANNIYRGQFIYDNLMIAANVIHAAYTYGVTKLLFLGSSCIYPRICPQPIEENMFMMGLLEQTNEPYALAKIAGIGLCQAYRAEYGSHFIACMPTNLYGPRDNFNQLTSHVVPALVGRIIDAHFSDKPTVTIWGTGTVRRELLYVEDCADALIFLMNKYDEYEIINIGTGIDHTITEIAIYIAEIVGYQGTFVYDTSKPDGTLVKRLDVQKIQKLGWCAFTPLRQGLTKTIEWYMEQYVSSGEKLYERTHLVS